MQLKDFKIGSTLQTVSNDLMVTDEIKCRPWILFFPFFLGGGGVGEWIMETRCWISQMTGNKLAQPIEKAIIFLLKMLYYTMFMQPFCKFKYNLSTASSV